MLDDAYDDMINLLISLRMLQYPFKFHRRLRLDGSATATNLTAVTVSECVSRAAPVVGSSVAVARCPSEFRGRDGILFSRSCPQ